MSILRRLLPKGVNFRLTRFFDELRKARGFDFEQLHKKSARKLRQGGSDYRCCIPALAGFVSPQSIAPDGARIFPQDRHYAITFCGKEIEALTSRNASVCIDAVKWLVLLLVVVLQCSCTTLVN